MALNRYVITAPVTVPAGTPATVVAGEPGTGGAAGHGTTGISAGYGAFPQTIVAGQVIEFDPATTAGAALQAAIGAGNLRAYVQGQDDAGHAAGTKAVATSWPQSRRAARAWVDNMLLGPWLG